MERQVFEWIYVACFILGAIVRGVYTRHRRSNRVTKRGGGVLDTALLSLASLGFLLPVVYLATSWLDFAACLVAGVRWHGGFRRVPVAAVASPR